ncbi:MAG TPA: hypothetical protein VMR89_09345 [Actinomycetota bacterium]|nr:hypothetical protein [Actinomycetota bacterium]
MGGQHSFEAIGVVLVEAVECPDGQELVAGGDRTTRSSSRATAGSAEPMSALGGLPMVIDTLVFAALLEIG